MRESLPLLPFFALVAIFLIVPTVTVIVSAFFVDGVFSSTASRRCSPTPRCPRCGKSVLLSASTAVIGAVLGAVLAWLIVSSPPTSVLRRAVHLAVQRAGPVRRRRTGFRVPRHDRAERRADAVGAAALRLEPRRLRLAVQPDRADPGLHATSRSR